MRRTDRGIGMLHMADRANVVRLAKAAVAADGAIEPVGDIDGGKGHE